MVGWRGVSSSWPEEGDEGKLAFEAGALGENVQLLMQEEDAENYH